MKSREAKRPAWNRTKVSIGQQLPDQSRAKLSNIHAQGFLEISETINKVKKYTESNKFMEILKTCEKLQLNRGKSLTVYQKVEIPGKS